MSIDDIREKYGPAVAAWCEAKALEEGEIPSEARISARIRPSEPPPPGDPRGPRQGSR